jgi:hypothetical protein
VGGLDEGCASGGGMTIVLGGGTAGGTADMGG